MSDLRGLPPTVPVWSDDPDEPSARLFFPYLSRGALYAGVREGAIPSVRIRGRVFVVTAKCLALLGLDGDARVDAPMGNPGLVVQQEGSASNGQGQLPARMPEPGRESSSEEAS
jgi:hypothetical protein